MHYTACEWKIFAGRTIYGKLYRPDPKDNTAPDTLDTPESHATPPYPVVIFSHGYNGCHADFERECSFLAEHGIAAYAFDFCGASTRSKSDGNSLLLTPFTMKDDLLAVVEAISALDFIDRNKITLFGGSQGGFVSALAAEEAKEKIHSLILCYPALCIPDNWQERFPSLEDIPEAVDFWGLRLGRAYFASIHGFDVFANIGKYDRNVLIVHGDRDEIVPLSYSVRAQKVYPHAELYVLPGEGHGYTPEGINAMLSVMLPFLNRCE